MGDRLSLGVDVDGRVLKIDGRTDRLSGDFDVSTASGGTWTSPVVEDHKRLVKQASK